MNSTHIAHDNNNNVRTDRKGLLHEIVNCYVCAVLLASMLGCGTLCRQVVIEAESSSMLESPSGREVSMRIVANLYVLVRAEHRRRALEPCTTASEQQQKMACRVVSSSRATSVVPRLLTVGRWAAPSRIAANHRQASTTLHAEARPQRAIHLLAAALRRATCSTSHGIRLRAAGSLSVSHTLPAPLHRSLPCFPPDPH